MKTVTLFASRQTNSFFVASNEGDNGFVQLWLSAITLS
jgi:hypothetical protein